jgi:hypothetical protein
VRGSAVLVAPQGFTHIESKGDSTVFHNDPQSIPHTEKWNSQTDFAAHLVALMFPLRD